jgi:hypothetical protein
MYMAPKTYTCQHEARLTRYYNNMRYIGLLLFFFVSLAPDTIHVSVADNDPV